MVFLGNKKDEIIPYEASLFKNIDKQDREFLRVLDKDANHWRPLKREISYKIIRSLGL